MVVDAFVEYEPAQPVLVKPTFWGGGLCSEPLPPCEQPKCNCFRLSSGRCSIRKLLPRDADATSFDPELGWCTEPKCAPFVASRFDPDADGLTPEEQNVYDPAASAFVLKEGVCTALPNLPTAITSADRRLPDENLPHSYKFTCADECKGQLAWFIGSDDCDETEIPQLYPYSLDIKVGDPDTLRIFAFEGASACFESSATFGFQGLPSLSMTYVGDARCPCE